MLITVIVLSVVQMLCEMLFPEGSIKKTLSMVSGLLIAMATAELIFDVLTGIF